MYKLIIADDEKTIREGLKCLLDWENLGFTVAGDAANGEDALALIAREKPDIVLLDIRMPKLSGLEVARHAREAGFDGKIVILSGYSDFNYAKEAIRYGVLSYLTKPIDEDELTGLVTQVRARLDADAAARDASAHYRRKAYDTIIRDILSGTADFSKLNAGELQLDADIYQVVICEKYTPGESDVSYRFSELLRVTNQNRSSFDNITDGCREFFLLKGNFALRKFNEFLTRYESEPHPQKDSPLDSLFLAYGRPVHTLSDIPDSFRDACKLIDRRFFCEQGQHTIGYERLPVLSGCAPLISPEFLDSYAARLFDALSAFRHRKTAEILEELLLSFYSSADSIDTIRLFFADLYLQLKERINRTYSGADIPFPSNADIIRTISAKPYLYEIILFLTEQFERILSAIGHSSRDGVIDDILYYIGHNYTRSITLESIAPLFGYNSSYLGKIFAKKVGENFNSYLDHVRIERSKELLCNDTMKVYEIAEKVGYRNVDYFHIKFKKLVGQTPAEFRKNVRGAQNA